MGGAVGKADGANGSDAIVHDPASGKRGELLTSVVGHYGSFDGAPNNTLRPKDKSEAAFIRCMVEVYQVDEQTVKDALEGKKGTDGSRSPADKFRQMHDNWVKGASVRMWPTLDLDGAAKSKAPPAKQGDVQTGVKKDDKPLDPKPPAGAPAEAPTDPKQVGDLAKRKLGDLKMTLPTTLVKKYDLENLAAACETGGPAAYAKFAQACAKANQEAAPIPTDAQVSAALKQLGFSGDFNADLAKVKEKFPQSGDSPAEIQRFVVASGLFLKGRDLEAAGNYGAADALLKQSYTYRPSPNTLIYLARAEHALGHTDQAKALFKRVIDEGGSNPAYKDTVESAKNELAELDEKPAKPAATPQGQPKVAGPKRQEIWEQQSEALQNEAHYAQSDIKSSKSTYTDGKWSDGDINKQIGVINRRIGKLNDAIKANGKAAAGDIANAKAEIANLNTEIERLKLIKRVAPTSDIDANYDRVASKYKGDAGGRHWRTGESANWDEKVFWSTLRTMADNYKLQHKTVAEFEADAAALYVSFTNP